MLKTLPEERQADIVALIDKTTLAKAAAELRKDGIDTSRSALSSFYQWWHLQRRFREDAETTETLLDQLKREVPEIDPAKLDDYGQRAFSLLAIRREDPETFLKVRDARFRAELEREKLKIRRERLEIDSRKLDLLERKAAAMDKVDEESQKPGGLTKERLAQIRREAGLG